MRSCATLDAEVKFSISETWITLSFLPNIKLSIKYLKPTWVPDLYKYLYSLTGFVARTLPPQPAIFQWSLNSCWHNKAFALNIGLTLLCIWFLIYTLYALTLKAFKHFRPIQFLTKTTLCSIHRNVEGKPGVVSPQADTAHQVGDLRRDFIPAAI